MNEEKREQNESFIGLTDFWEMLVRHNETG